MKVKLKKWMEKMTRAVKPTTCTAVSFPFTPTCNGLLIGLIRAGVQGRCYVTLTNAIPNIIDAYQVAGGYCVGAVFVTKNNKVEQSGSSNILQTSYYFIPLVGGVLRNPVISRLTAILTSLLSGGDVVEAEHKEAVGEGARKTTEYSDNKTSRISYNKRYSTNIWGIFLGSKHISKWMVAAPILVSIRELCDHNSGSRSIRPDTDNRVQHQSFAANYCACAVHEGIAISERRWAA